MSRFSRHWMIWIGLFILSTTAVGLSLILIRTVFTGKTPPGAIYKVGSEYIFQKDLDYEVSLYPKTSLTQDQIIESLTNKLVEDSEILQGAQKDEITTLDDSVFNNSNKDYLKRMALIKDIKEKLANNPYTVNGSMITLWFFNNGLAPKGYEQAKSIAYEKMKSIHDDVVSGKMSMQGAYNAIVNDQSLVEIDPAYKNNAYGNFKNIAGEKITFDPVFDNMIWNTEENNYTDLYMLVEDSEKIKNTGVAYIFAYIDSKEGNPNAISYEQWLAKQKNTYKSQKVT
ncbi:hypothetical protein HGA91_02780 [candidate division WWE3 bacterium]|nr:hypothetical protein [candidate division WWE3 bacterium]